MKRSETKKGEAMPLPNDDTYIYYGQPIEQI